MAPVRGDGSQNCSCTSCFYKSESDQPSMRRMIAHGSRIDRLYFGKYVPLRERKLLDKLVRTRAVYDDVRNQLVSGSSISISKKADLKPRKKLAPMGKELDDIQKSGAILELVDLVDKGAVLGPKKLSECCSCCFCSSNALIPEHTTKGRRHRHGHRHRHEKRHRDARESSNASDVSGHGLGMESRREKNLKIVAKQIQSDPCTCSIKMSGMIRRHSKAMLKKLHTERPEPMLDESYDSEWGDTHQRKWHKRGAQIKKSLQEIKQAHEIENEISKYRLMESLAKVNRSKAKLKNNLEAGAKRSFEKIKNAKIKIKENLDSRIKESIQKLKTKSAQLSNLEGNLFNIKKDSITQFREKLDRKRHLKKNRKHSTRRYRHEKSGDASNVSDISVQAKKVGATVKAGTKKLKSMSRKIEFTKVAPGQRISVDLTLKKGGVKQEITTQIQEKVSKSKVVGNQEIAFKNQEKVSKSKGVGNNQEIAFKNQEKGTKSKQDGNQELEKKLKEIKPKRVEKPQITTQKVTKSESIKSMTNIQPKISKHSVSSTTSAVDKGVKEIKTLAHKAGTQKSIAKKAEKVSATNKEIIKQISVDDNKSPRNAVKARSSTEIESGFSKNKPTTESKGNVKTRDKGQMRQSNHRSKYADARHKLLAKDTQAGLALKRCFCTLKLKAKRTKLKATKSKLTSTNLKRDSVTEAVQTNKAPISSKKVHPSQRSYELLPYECEPFVCEPGECNPIECEKRIKKRGRKYHTSRTNTDYSMKSSHSLTPRSSSSVTSRKNQVSSPKKPVKTESSTSNLAVQPAVDSLKPHKQVVRISSSFSFNIEFKKETPSNALEEITDVQHTSKVESPNKRRKSKGVHQAKRHIRHKRSQISSSTGKSKYTTTKHNLRRCFCTLKLAKSGKKQIRDMQISKSTLTSRHKIRQTRSVNPEVRSRAIATDRETCRNKPICRIMAHECEPGVCEPGYCDPYDCLEIMKRRNIKRRNVHSSTDYRKIRSASSLTSKSVNTTKAKKIQSAFTTLKSDVPVNYVKKKSTALDDMKTLPSNYNKQALRIGSSFSFDIEFFKDKSSPDVNTTIENVQESPRPQTYVRKELKERGLQGNIKSRNKSTLMKKNERSVMIGPALKRCFCTLKLHKAGKNKRISNTVNTGTETPTFKNKVYPNVEKVSKATKTNKNFTNKRRLQPYECEPNFCVPGECDPYECLNRINKRDIESKSFGVMTNRSNVKTSSSITKKVSGRSKNTYAQIKDKKMKTVKGKKSQKAVTSSDQSRKSVNMFPTTHSRQAVKIGSNFSFDIQFFKDRSTGKTANENIASVKSFGKTTKKLKHKGENPLNVSVNERNSQSEMIKRKHRATGVGPMLKRCFCTLKLQNTQKRKQRHDNQTFTHLKSPEVYTVSKISIAGNKLMKPLDCEDKYAGYRTKTFEINSYCKPTPSIIPAPNSIFKFKDMQSYFNKTKESLLELQSINQSFTKQKLQINSEITSRVKITKEMYDFHSLNKQKNIETVFTESLISAERYVQTAENNMNSFTIQSSEKIAGDGVTSNINGFSQYLKRRFFTMNIQVPGRDKPNKRISNAVTTDQRPQPNKHKLDPYECEPGFCIPYECDPIECQKRIMKRLMRGASKMSGTDIRSKSSSSYTNFSTPHHKRKKIQYAGPRPSRPSKVPREKRQGITYKTVPTTRRQAVRVGSKFSFNIEFSKGRSQTSEKAIDKPKYSNKKLKAIDSKFKTRGTKGTENSRQQRETQSRLIRMEDRASNISPMLKRCFCTLKLQKRGRQHKKHVKSVNQGTETPPNSSNDVDKTMYVNAGQNTRSPKAYKLLPYECEPNVCVPGQCNPYECLELIKKRNRKTKSFGTDSGQSISRSSSTNYQKKKNKGKHVQSSFKHKPKTSKNKDFQRSEVPTHAAKSSRQAVRVGSCFSFDVEFYKDRRHHGDPVPNRHIKYISESRDKVREYTPKRGRRKRKTVKERSSQDSKMSNDQNSQAEGVAKHTKSSMTSSLMKRCFCTLKHFKRPVKRPQKTASTETEAIIQQNNFGRDIGIQHGRKYRPYALDPNECEPGICIPGACDPYVCAKNIRKRNARYDSKISGTDRVRTKSVSSGFTSSVPSKLKQTQSQPERAVRKVKPKSYPDYSTSETYHRPVSSNRQAVRIGSTFSFDIEFYKEKSPHYRQVQAAAKAIKGKPQRRQLKSREVITKPKTNSKGVANDEISLLSRESQAQTVKQRNQGSGVGPLLKRCFCTLKLHKQKIQDNTEHSAKKMMRTQSVMTDKNRRPKKYSLKPYECEPGVCIPGECDPYECDKLIQKRNRKDSSTIMRHHTRSTSSWAKSNSKYKNRNIQYAGKQKKQQKMKSIITTKEPKQKSKQAVKIGSNFSFNVEFFKDKSYGSGEINTRSAKMRQDPKRVTNSSFIKHKNQKSQRVKGIRHMDSQVFAKKMRSTMTGMSPFLKRCFCTLKLKNKKPVNTKSAATEINQKIKLQVYPTIDTSNKETYTKKTRVDYSSRNLDPYECEPGVCVPYECNPYECEKRIKKRLMRSEFSSTEKPRRRSVSVLSDSVSSQTKNTQATYRERKHRKTRNDGKKYPTKEMRVTSANSKKQAVKVGSSFSFNVEFFKDRSQDRNVTREADTYNYPTDNKYKMNDVEKRKKTRNSAAFKEDVGSHNRHSQAEGARTQSRASGMGPLLKRCFCTLKLQKTGHGQKQYITKNVRETAIAKYSPVIEARNVKVSTTRNVRHLEPYQTKFNPVIEARNVSISMPTRKKLRSLEPFECEPNVCVPGHCDPLECEKRIKRRMKELGTGTVTTHMKSVSSLTRGRTRTSKSTKAHIVNETERHHKTLKDKAPKRDIKHPVDTTAMGRQCVRLGSNFSFDIEFYKGGSQHQDFKNKRPNTKSISPSIKTKRSETKNKQIRSQGSSCIDNCQRDKYLQSEAVKTESRGSGMGTLLKRCFCTLTLQNKTETSKPKKSDNREPSKVTTQSKATSTKTKKIERILDPYECEPLSCIPGECDPYECLKRIKNRGIRRQSRTAATHTRRPSHVSVSSMISQLRTSGKSKRMQANFRDKTDMVVEQPRFPINRLNRQAVKIGSNISFNIEFYKETGPFNQLNYANVKQTKKVLKDKNLDGLDVTSVKDKYVHSELVKHHNTESQVGTKTENKSSLAGNALKRCFCTAKLQRTNTHTIPQNAKHTYPNVMTVNHVYRAPFFNPVQCYFQYEHHNTNDTNQKCIEACAIHYAKTKGKSTTEKDEKKTSKNVYFNQKNKIKKGQKFNETNDSTNMETIFPYTPSKFKKSVSKSVLPLKSVEGKRKSILKQNKEVPFENEQSKSSKIPTNRKLTAKKGKKSIKSTPMDTIKSNPLHGLMCRCKHIFKKQGKAMSSDENKITDLHNSTKCNRGRGLQADPCTCSKSFQPDKLKISKSERTAKHQKKESEPKKSKSLKTAKVSDKRKCLNECRFLEQGKRKFSIFQSGDAEQIHLKNSKKHGKDSNQKSVQFSIKSPTRTKKHIGYKMPDASQTNKQIKKCNECNEKSPQPNHLENKSNRIPSKLSCFISKCVCKLSNMVKVNSKSTEDYKQKDPMKKKKLQKSKSLGINSKTCPGCDMSNKKNNFNTPISSGDGFATTVPSPTREAKRRNNKQAKKSLPEINISRKKVTLPTDMLEPKYYKSPVIKKSILRTIIHKTQKDAVPVLKISDNMITFPESLLSPRKSSAFRVPKLTRTSKFKMIAGAKLTIKPKREIPIKVCTCGNSTCAELTMKRQLEEQDEQGKANDRIKPCICGSSPCAEETKKRFMSAVKKSSKLKLPKPCICKSAVCAKESMKRILHEKKKLSENKPENPCICGSSLCAKEQKRLLELHKDKNIANPPCVCKFPPCAKERKRVLEKENDKTIKASAKPCVCGSKVCSKERSRMIESKLKHKPKKKKKNIQKTNRIPDNMSKEEFNEYKKRLKQYKKEDDLIKKKRMNDQKYMDDQVGRFKNASGGLLVAESVRDIGSLAFNVASDILRCTYRAITDPMRTKVAVKKAVKNPKRAGFKLKNALLDTGVQSTNRRMSRRCASIRTVQALKTKLEENAFTNYLIHINDKDPKRRFNKKKKGREKKEREPLDFGCSLYMGSLRRRPYLAVYYLCPWFYPHCISLMTLLRQFIDILLFLLAVVVWSPCIVGMEVCRAMMCCFFCTG